MSRRLEALLLLAAPGLLAFTVVRDPNVEEPIRWSPATVTITIQQSGSDDVSDGSDLAAIRASLDTWTAVAGSDFAFVDGGTTSSRADVDDGVNLITFIESGWPWGASGAGGLTSRYRDTGDDPDTWREADLIVNGQQFTWATVVTLHDYDIQTVVTHELGHVLGLNHTADPTATMYFAGQRGRHLARTVGADDIAGLVYLYPSGAFSCTTDLDCPVLYNWYGGGGTVRQHCNTGSCETGTVSYGADCYSGTECDSGFCHPETFGGAGSDPGFCSESCTTGSCPNGDLCADVGSGFGDRCMIGRDDCWFTDAPPDTAPCLGSNAYCWRGLDGQFRCRSACLADSHCSAFAGATCLDPIDGSNPGFCIPRGPLLTGSCDSPLDCHSLICTTDGVGLPACVPGVIGGDAAPPPDGATPGDTTTPGDDATPGDNFVPGGDDFVPGGDDFVPGGDQARGDPITAGDTGGQVFPGDTTAGSDPDLILTPSGCACNTGSGGPWWAFLLLLGLGYARRETR